MKAIGFWFKSVPLLGALCFFAFGSVCRADISSAAPTDRCDRTWWQKRHQSERASVRSPRYVLAVPKNSLPIFGPNLWPDDGHMELRAAEMIRRVRAVDGTAGFSVFLFERRTLDILEALAKGPLRQ